MCRMFPNGEQGKRILNKQFSKVRRQGKGASYDCVVGISGGRDSIVLLRKVVKEWGLRPLAVHFNDGFDNPVAGENMINAVEKLGVDLITITSDWREAKDLKISFLKASVPDLNLGTDIGIASSLYGEALLRACTGSICSSLVGPVLSPNPLHKAPLLRIHDWVESMLHLSPSHIITHTHTHNSCFNVLRLPKLNNVRCE